MRLPLLVVLSLAACEGGKDGNVDVEGPNRAPEAPRIRVGPEDPTTRDDLEAYILDEAIDPDGDPVTYTYRWFRDGELVEDLTEAVVPAGETERGEEWEAVVAASDGELTGPSDQDDVEIINAPPEISLQLGPESPDTEATLTAVVEVEDPDDDEASWSIAWTRNGTAQDEIDGTEVRPGKTTRGDVWTVIVTAADTEDGEASEQASLTIRNATPIVNSAAFTPATVRVGDTLRGAADAEDADGDALTTTWRWLLDGVTVAEGPESSFEGTFSRGSLVGLEVVVSDGDLSSATFSVDGVIVANSAPSAAGATLSPAEPNEDKDIDCALDGAFDADGDAVSATWVWEVDGVEVPGATGPTLSADHTERGQNVRCTAIPNDGTEDGEPVISAPLVVKNRAPSAGSASITAAADGTLSVTVIGASDPDEDAVSYAYEWSVEGRVVATSATLAPALFDRGDEVRVEVTPTDGDLDGPSVTSPVYEVPDNPPFIRSLTLNPTVVYTDTNVDAVVVAEDPDGDAVTVTRAWTVNGGAVTGSGTSLQASKFARGDVIRVSVTATANGKSSAASVATVTVANRPPSAPVASLGSGIPEAGVPLVCSLATASTDADADAITYSVAWEEDGVPYTGAVQNTGAIPGDRVAGGQIADGEAWSCTITATDGTASTRSAEASTVIGDPAVVEACLNEALPQAIADAVDAQLGGRAWTFPRQTAGSNLISQVIVTDLELDVDAPTGSWALDGRAWATWPASWNSAASPHEVRWTGIVTSDGNCKAYAEDSSLSLHMEASASYTPASGVTVDLDIAGSIYEDPSVFTLTGPKCNLSWLAITETTAGQTHAGIVFFAGLDIWSNALNGNEAAIEDEVRATITAACL